MCVALCVVFVMWLCCVVLDVRDACVVVLCVWCVVCVLWCVVVSVVVVVVVVVVDIGVMLDLCCVLCGV